MLLNECQSHLLPNKEKQFLLYLIMKFLFFVLYTKIVWELHQIQCILHQNYISHVAVWKLFEDHLRDSSYLDHKCVFLAKRHQVSCFQHQFAVDYHHKPTKFEY